MIPDTWMHRLSFAVRFRNHFTDEAVQDELPVRLATSRIKPVLTGDGLGRRHADGSYRFADVPAGLHLVSWTLALEPTFRDWTCWNQALQIRLPLARPEEPIEQELWPTASAIVSPGLTAIRGQLQGAGRSNLEVRIAPPGLAMNHYSRTDEYGDFLYLLPDALRPDARGRADLQISVASRTVTGGEYIPTGAGAAFVGANFKVRIGIVSRIVYQIT